MMKGQNELKLNEATLIEAVQYWLTNKVWHAKEPVPTITSIKPSADYQGCAFVVNLKSEEDNV